MSIMENSSIQEESLNSAAVVSEVEAKAKAEVKAEDVQAVDSVKTDTEKNNQNILEQEDDSANKILSVEAKTEIVEKLNKAVELFDSDIRFVKNPDVEDQTVYVEVYSKETGEVIRRIPPESLKQSLKNISELTGLLIDQIG